GTAVAVPDGAVAALLLVVAAPHAEDVIVEQGVGAGGDISVGGDVNIGLTPIQVRELMRQIQEQQGAGIKKVARLSRRLGVTESALASFFRILGRQNVPIEQLPATLVEIAQRHRRLLDQIGALPAQSPAIQALKDRARAAVKQGDYERAQRLLAKAEDAVLEAARRLREQADQQFLDAAATRAQRGELSLVQLDYAAAARHFRSAAELVPDSSPLVRADHLNRCGIAAYQAADYASAESAFDEALDIRKRHLPRDHPDVGQSLNNLATLYHSQGRYEEAEPLYRRALAIREAALGPDHPDVATSLNNLALLYQAQGRYEEAEPLYRRMLAILERALPPNHPYRAVGAKNYAELLRKLGRDKEAAQWAAKAAAIRQARDGSPRADKLLGVDAGAVAEPQANGFQPDP
ncbi:MAG: tetratricopeptide repeat protein, partial [Nitrococcus sp.]|nr:tetratricopeptide repeat protein [Nitrococcus sp.]